MKKSFVASIDRHQPFELGRVRVGQLLRRHPRLLRRILHRLPVLIGAGQEEDVVPPLPMMPREDVRSHRRVRVPQMGLRVDVVDRGGDVEAHGAVSLEDAHPPAPRPGDGRRHYGRTVKTFFAGFDFLPAPLTTWTLSVCLPGSSCGVLYFLPFLLFLPQPLNLPLSSLQRNRAGSWLERSLKTGALGARLFRPVDLCRLRLRCEDRHLHRRPHRTARRGARERQLELPVVAGFRVPLDGDRHRPVGAVVREAESPRRSKEVLTGFGRPVHGREVDAGCAFDPRTANDTETERLFFRRDFDRATGEFKGQRAVPLETIGAVRQSSLYSQSAGCRVDGHQIGRRFAEVVQGRVERRPCAVPCGGS